MPPKACGRRRQKKVKSGCLASSGISEVKGLGAQVFPCSQMSAFACRPGCTIDSDPMQYFGYLCAPYCCILTEGTRSTEGRLNDATLDYISYYQWLVVLLIDTYVDLHGARQCHLMGACPCRLESPLVQLRRNCKISLFLKSFFIIMIDIEFYVYSIKIIYKALIINLNV